jgi:hypothetical protein
MDSDTEIDMITHMDTIVTMLQVIIIKFFSQTNFFSTMFSKFILLRRFIKIFVCIVIL